MTSLPFVPVLAPGDPFPDPHYAQGDGLVAIGADLSPERLLQAYRNGIFPWSCDPVTWWSPDPRGIIEFNSLHLSRRMRQTLKQRPLTITANQAFVQVIIACAQPAKGRESTWIEPPLIEAYCDLHRRGWAHSIECWSGPHLVGGLYGVSVGGLFAGESMFFKESNASKITLAYTLAHLEKCGFVLFDTQMTTAHTRRLGAQDIKRAQYLRRLKSAIKVQASFDSQVDMEALTKSLISR